MKQKTDNSMSMEEKKVNVGCFVEFCLFVMMMCSVTQCLGVTSLDIKLKDIDKNIRILTVRDSVAVDSVVVYKMK